MRSMIRSYISIANGGAGCDQLDGTISAMIYTVTNPYRFVRGMMVDGALTNRDTWVSKVGIDIELRGQRLGIR